VTADTGTSSRRLRAVPDSPVRVLDLDLVEYRAAWALQQRLVVARQADEIGDTVVLVEHPPVYTLGRRATGTNVLLDATELAAAGIDVVNVDRGGDVTYHGPGQLVVYPVVRLAGQRHVVDFVRALEEVALGALDRLGVTAERRHGLTGVWVGREKIVAIGVRVGAGGVTSHGLALNVDPDLAHFAGIVPCGLATEGVTSLARLGVAARMPQARLAVRAALSEVLDAALIDTDPDEGHEDRADLRIPAHLEAEALR
jgi:lipoyl(octanoyl) transferase